VLQGNGGWITFRNEAVKPTRNARCWQKIGTVGKRRPGSDHYLSRNRLEERRLLYEEEAAVVKRPIHVNDTTQLNQTGSRVELSLTDI